MEYRKLGRYNLERSLAKGGMGEVVLSVDERGRPVALKKILANFQRDSTFRQLFIREAEITFQLEHPNIVQAYGFEKIGRQLVLALEYLEGVNLKEVLRTCYEKGIHIPVPVAIEIVKRVLRGLNYAHKKKNTKGEHLGIIHRDLNPANIFITYKGDVKILDFGISKATTKEVHSLTPKGELRGKMCYLAPEQVRDLPLDHRADIFAVGILLWELITSRPLFLREDDLKVLEAIARAEYKSPIQFRPDLPEEIETILKTALSRKPEGRFKTAGDFESALEGLSGFGKHIVPGINEEEISIFVRTLFKKDLKNQDPNFRSGFAFLLTQMPGWEHKGVETALKTAVEYPETAYVQLNYARSLICAGRKQEGFVAIKKLSTIGVLEQPVQKLLEWLGVRRQPVLSFLNRRHPINHLLGRIRHLVLGQTPAQECFQKAA